MVFYNSGRLKPEARFLLSSPTGENSAHVT